ncbi:TetR/AcrR family transcriptional regulator [Bombilactobacillus thymidiniphilus]|uniref:TetR/AcrR family transcriptional regulator n=1 Tax=Bombilactobacillus thymidiniphilus TaxID=2923363 RepID=A0ABY4PF14_9LACO|nr:TetR/AcrR family transcriptional regulator [Bombilactobacillus thymidiniphilus]UQS84235.1 TetR/AcrR family transcriptional regulator [Bombilactobacillus thymidiniphilus]
MDSTIPTKLTAKYKIARSLIDLLQHNDMHHVTITQVCRYAHINRSTFYHYYKSLDEVLDDIQQYYKRIISEFFTTSKHLDDYHSNYDHYVHSFLKYIQMNAKSFRVLLSSDCIDSFKQNALEIAHKINIYKETKEEQRYAVAGDVELIRHWLYSDHPTSLEHLSEVFIKFIPHI